MLVDVTALQAVGGPPPADDHREQPGPCHGCPDNAWPCRERCRGQGQQASQRPWDGAEGLEWEVPSPAPFHTFENPPKLDATATKVIG